MAESTNQVLVLNGQMMAKQERVNVGKCVNPLLFTITLLDAKVPLVWWAQVDPENQMVPDDKIINI